MVPRATQFEMAFCGRYENEHGLMNEILDQEDYEKRNQYMRVASTKEGL